MRDDGLVGNEENRVVLLAATALLLVKPIEAECEVRDRKEGGEGSGGGGGGVPRWNVGTANHSLTSGDRLSGRGRWPLDRSNQREMVRTQAHFLIRLAVRS